MQIDMGDMLGIEFILASWTNMAFSLPGGDIVMTVGIWVVVHLQGHSFPFSAVYGQPRSSGLLGLTSADFFGLVSFHDRWAQALIHGTSSISTWTFSDA